MSIWTPVHFAPMINFKKFLGSINFWHPKSFKRWVVDTFWQPIWLATCWKNQLSFQKMWRNNTSNSICLMLLLRSLHLRWSWGDNYTRHSLKIVLSKMSVFRFKIWNIMDTLIEFTYCSWKINLDQGVFMSISLKHGNHGWVLLDTSIKTNVS